LPACNVSLAYLTAQLVVGIGQQCPAAGFLIEQQAVFVVGVAVVHAACDGRYKLTIGRIFIAIAQIACLALDKTAVDIPLVLIRYTISVLELD